ncbi:MAG: hypothetical protein WC003_02930 [Terrimicrobiaceae bacterium]
MKRAIEEDFPIVEINRLVVPERNGFKEIYQMHKSFAPRASCVFRAILLSAFKPVGANIMEEFYKDHSCDPDTKRKRIFDPFNGGGTTAVEASRMGFDVTGIELNPVPWFVVKMAFAEASVADLDAALQRLGQRTVEWSGKTVNETLSSLYQVPIPFHSASEHRSADVSAYVFHTYWMKSGVCTAPTCRKLVPLFKNYVVASKSPSIRYHTDCKCPKCNGTFDWEVEPASMVADPRLMVHATTYSGGEGRSTIRWTYAHPSGGLYVCQEKAGGGQSQVRYGTLQTGEVCCPHCHEIVRPRLASTKKLKRKKIPITVLVCPQTEQVFQWRGPLDAASSKLTSLAGHEFQPFVGNVPDEGSEFICPHCGQRDGNSVINSINSLGENERLPMHAYACQAYWAPSDPREEDEDDDARDDLFDRGNQQSSEFLPRGSNLIWKNKGKYFSSITPEIGTVFQRAEAAWNQYKESLPWPRSSIPNGEKTKSGLHSHHYRDWKDMFNQRQLLALGTLLAAIREEQHDGCRELLLLVFSGAVERNNLFCRFFNGRNTIQGSFDRHDFAPKLDPSENCVWGPSEIRGSFSNMFGRVREGVAFRTAVWDRDIDHLGEDDSKFASKEVVTPLGATLLNGDSREIIPALDGLFDAIITDPPYAGNVNYSELYDFFYVWLRLALKDTYPSFQPEYTPKIPEIIENKSRGLSNEDFRVGLQTVFARGREKLKDDGVLVFTYHHSGTQQWVDLCDAVCLAGFVIEAVYPVHAEKESSLNLQNNKGISYDLIHVCRKRREADGNAKRSWAGLRQLVRTRARDEIKRIEAGRYGGRPLAPADVRMVLIGKCLEVYSLHYGLVVDWEGKNYPLGDAMKDIGEMVEQMISKENPLPAELEGVDMLSRVWLRALCAQTEIPVDSIRKLTHGVFELDDLTGYKPPLMKKGRVQGGRTYRVLTPAERLEGLKPLLKADVPEFVQEPLPGLEAAVKVVVGPNLVDVLHLLLAHADTGERLDVLVNRFGAQREAIRAALEYLNTRDPNRWGMACGKLLPFYTEEWMGKFFGQDFRNPILP